MFAYISHYGNVIHNSTENATMLFGIMAKFPHNDIFMSCFLWAYIKTA